MKQLLSGNAALARGAWEAGAMVAAGYPGTPSTEILEHFARYPGVYAEWSPNEKVALDVAIGAAYAGRRAFATMKHVGLNVAADAFMYVAMTGIEGGLVIISADDPAMHSSQNEQDNRMYAKFARIPCLEPASSQAARDQMLDAFAISEQFDTPVMLRVTTRICHSTSEVILGNPPPRTGLDEAAPPAPRFPRNPGKYVMVPGNAVKRHPVIEDRLRRIATFAETYPGNVMVPGSSGLGIITTGISYQYAREVFPDAAILHLGMSWPLPAHMIRNFAASVNRLIVMEELDPFVEEGVRLLGVTLAPDHPEATGKSVEGKSIFPIIGEFSPRIIREHAIAAGLLPASAHIATPDLTSNNLPPRPPVLCAGCPHRSSFYMLHKLKVPVNGDIGCYSLGFAPPLSAMHTLGCMGAGISVAHGASKAGSPERHVAVIGDSTFFHSGIPALLNVVYHHSPVVTIILDNRVTAMTGHQGTPATGDTLQPGQIHTDPSTGQPTPIAIEPIVRALGIQHVQTIDAFAVDAIEATLRVFLQLNAPSVLIALQPCALEAAGRARWRPLQVAADQCNGCTLCFRLGCPAILKSDELDAHTQRPKAIIDPTQCTGCEVCSQICPRDAISFRDDALSLATAVTPEVRR